MGDNLEKNIPLTETMFLVLLTMLEENYGYKVSQEVEEITGGRIVLGPGTLYGAINNLSNIGKKLVLLEIDRMRTLVLEGEKKLKKKGNYE